MSTRKRSKTPSEAVSEAGSPRAVQLQARLRVEGRGVWGPVAEPVVLVVVVNREGAETPYLGTLKELHDKLAPQGLADDLLMVTDGAGVALVLRGQGTRSDRNGPGNTEDVPGAAVNERKKIKQLKKRIKKARKLLEIELEVYLGSPPETLVEIHEVLTGKRL